ncbi:hypothetical protein OKW30_006008 [Paraburkholderia sp. Clong3]|uniref:hypothetical protein n=1 Tax=Paraburkholderia sp. Clong3 TaxID=2991061 RepID=UPI003D1978DC
MTSNAFITNELLAEHVVFMTRADEKEPTDRRPTKIPATLFTYPASTLAATPAPAPAVAD